MTEPLTASQARLQEDLRGLIRGDVNCDDVVLQLYSSDGSPFEERPLGVVWPRTSQDVVAIVQYASEKNLTVSLRGSGASGGCAAIGSGLVVDFSRYMRRALYVGDDYARVQPGAIRERLNDQLRATRGRIFGPNSGHIPTGTIGGIVSVDNIGPRWLRYGAPHESVLGLKVVDATGRLWELKPFRALNLAETVDPTRNAFFRRQFLTAALADANDAAERALFDNERERPDLDRGLEEELLNVENAKRSGYGLDFNGGKEWRSFRDREARDAFFTRAFGDKAQDVRAFFRNKTWVDALRVLRRYESYLDKEQRRAYPFRAGFALRDVLRFGFDPARLFVGAEGALGVIVEATLATAAKAAASAAVILLFDSIDAAARATPTILTFEPTLCDLLDSRVITLTRDWDARFEAVFPQSCEAALVVEFDADSERELYARATSLVETARESFGSFGSWTAFHEQERRLFRDLLRKSSCARLRMSPSFQYFPYWEDARVPVEALADFLREIQNLFKRERLVYSVGGSVGCGSLSIQPILPYSEEEERRAFVLSDDFENLVLRYGGEIGFAKGNGRVRTAAIPKRYPNLFRAFVEIKDVFDPKNILNPDCVVSPEMRRMAREDSLGAYAEKDENLHAPQRSEERDVSMLAPEADAVLRESSLHVRGVKRREPFDVQLLRRYDDMNWLNRPGRRQLEYQIDWNPAQIYASAYQCVGCGHCRIRTSETRMCPTFRHTPDEQATCRAKANLLRGVVDGKLSLETLIGDTSKKIADKCMQCYSCLTECPAQVDAARLAFRLKSAYNAANGLDYDQIFALRLDFFLAFAARFDKLYAKMIRRPVFRWILEKTLGIAQGRKLPLLQRRPYHKRIGSERSQPNFNDLMVEHENVAVPRARKVALFIDIYADYFDPELVDAAIAVLKRNGVDAQPLARPINSGSIAFDVGDVDSAERVAPKIVALEPSTAAYIKKAYPYFCNDDDAQAVYANTYDFSTYCHRMLQRGEFDREGLRPLRAEEKLALGYHAPCRSVALSGGALPSPTPAQSLLELVPGLEVQRLERGCCGLANYAAFTKTRFSESLRLGARLYLAARRPELNLCASECSLCNLQLSQGLSKPVAHVIKLLAVSYGDLALEDAYLVAYNANKKGERWKFNPIRNR